MFHLAASMNRIDAATVPFLAPAVVAWVTFGIGVMIYYFLIVARRPRAGKGLNEADRRPEPPPLPARPWVAPAPVLANLPAYDMEEFPEDEWGQLDAPPVPAAERRTRATRSSA